MWLPIRECSEDSRSTVMIDAPLRTANRAGAATLWPAPLLDVVLKDSASIVVTHTDEMLSSLFKDVCGRWPDDELLV
jgi:hypothetical protein